MQWSRSVKNKDAHIEDGHARTELPAREARRAVRSGTRGLGAARQGEELDVDAAFSLDLPDEPMVPNGPFGFGRALEVGSFHLLREIERSLILRSAVSLNFETEEIHGRTGARGLWDAFAVASI